MENKERLIEQTVATSRAFKRMVEIEKQAVIARDAVLRIDGQLTLAKTALAAEQSLHAKMIQEISEEDLESAWEQVMRKPWISA